MAKSRRRNKARFQADPILTNQGVTSGEKIEADTAASPNAVDAINSLSSAVMATTLSESADQPFRLLDLPQETQDKIYKAYLECETIPLPPTNQLPSLAIELVSRKVSSDVRKVREKTWPRSVRIEGYPKPARADSWDWVCNHAEELIFMPSIKRLIQELSQDWSTFLAAFAKVRTVVLYCDLGVEALWNDGDHMLAMLGLIWIDEYLDAPQLGVVQDLGIKKIADLLSVRGSEYLVQFQGYMKHATTQDQAYKALYQVVQIRLGIDKGKSEWRTSNEIVANKLLKAQGFQSPSEQMRIFMSEAEMEEVARIGGMEDVAADKRVAAIIEAQRLEREYLQTHFGENGDYLGTSDDDSIDEVEDDDGDEDE